MFKWWRRHQRATDMQILWPVCRQEARTLEDARQAFFVHCMMDPAWTKDFTTDEIISQVERLT